MGNTMNSTDEMIASAQTYGMWNIAYFNIGAGGGFTAATTSSGGITTGRVNSDIVMPSFGTGINCAFSTFADMWNEDSSTTMLLGIEYNFGSIALSSGTFTDGVAMPTKTVGGASVQTASMLSFCHIDSTLTGSPALSITYTDQDGNTGNTCSMTLPSGSLISSGFFMNPHLANGDTAIRDITACSRTGGTGGTVSFRGLLPLAWQIKGDYAISPLLYSMPKFPIATGETLAIWRFGSTSSYITVGAFGFLADT